LAFFEGLVILSLNFRQKGASRTNHCWCQKTRVIAFLCYQNIRNVLFGCVTKHVCDKRTDRQTELQQLNTALA